MTGTFTPRRDILPPAQRLLWPQLRAVTELGFVLYGGTAIALRLGHRASVDFDFFGSRALDRGALRAAVPFVRAAQVLQDAPDTLTLLAGTREGPVKVSLFGMPGLGHIGAPEGTDDGALLVASCADLLATKLKTILQRAEAKDYRDIAELLRAGTKLAGALAGARALLGPNFQPAEALKALTYFDDGDLATVPAADRALLVQQASTLGPLPTIGTTPGVAG